MNEDSIKRLLTLLESLPPTPSVTFRGYVDTSITEPRAISSPVLRAACSQRIDLPEGASEPFLIPVG